MLANDTNEVTRYQPRSTITKFVYGRIRTRRPYEVVNDRECSTWVLRIGENLSHEQFKNVLYSAKEDDESWGPNNPDANPRRHLWYLPCKSNLMIETTENTEKEIKPKWQMSLDCLPLGICGTPYTGQY